MDWSQVETLELTNVDLGTFMEHMSGELPHLKRLKLVPQWWLSDDDRLTLLALSQRLSLLGLIFRSSTPTSGKIILVNFRISLLKYIKLTNYYSRHYALSKTALLISFDQELLEL